MESIVVSSGIYYIIVRYIGWYINIKALLLGWLNLRVLVVMELLVESN